MRRAGWYLVTGAVAGFAGVLGLHIGGTAAPAVLGQPARGDAGKPSALAGGSAPAPYGQLSVTVPGRGSRIVAVSVPVLHTIDQYSQQLAQQVIPMLRSEVLAAHSAQIHGVSGATYTSEAYAQSIQSALDKLQLR